MSIKFLNHVWETSKSKGNDRLVLLAIADHADEHGFSWISLKTICKKVNASRPTIINALRSLESCGELVTRHRFNEDGSGNMSNLYCVVMSGIDQHDRVEIRGTRKLRKLKPAKAREWAFGSSDLKEKENALQAHKGLIEGSKEGLSNDGLTPPGNDGLTRGVKTGLQPKRKSKPEKAHAESDEPRPRNLIFEAVAKHIFGVDDVETLKSMQAKDDPSSRIGSITSWLTGKTDTVKYGPRGRKFVGFITGSEIKPEHIKAFAVWYAQKHPNASMVTDGEKFTTYWRKWASSMKAKQTPRPTTATPAPQPLNDAQKQQRQAELAAARNGASA